MFKTQNFFLILRKMFLKNRNIFNCLESLEIFFSNNLYCLNVHMFDFYICNRPAAPLPAKAHDTAENIQHIQGGGRETSDGEPIPPREGGEILQRNEEASAGECKAEREHEEAEIRNRRT